MLLFSYCEDRQNYHVLCALGKKVTCSTFSGQQREKGKYYKYGTANYYELHETLNVKRVSNVFHLSK